MSRPINKRLSDILEYGLKAINSYKLYTVAEQKNCSNTIKNIAFDAMIRDIEVIGEASRHIIKELNFIENDNDWWEAANMRNKLIHEYFIADKAIIKKTINKDVKNIMAKAYNILQTNYTTYFNTEIKEKYKNISKLANDIKNDDFEEYIFNTFKKLESTNAKST